MSNCLIDTINDDDSYEKPKLFVWKERIAVKSHVCCECQSIIKPGELYTFEKGLWDGEWGSFKTCNACLNIRHVFAISFEYTMLWKNLYDCFVTDGHEFPEERVNKLQTYSRTKFLDWYDKLPLGE